MDVLSDDLRHGVVRVDIQQRPARLDNVFRSRTERLARGDGFKTLMETNLVVVRCEVRLGVQLQLESDAFVLCVAVHCVDFLVRPSIDGYSQPGLFFLAVFRREGGDTS